MAKKEESATSVEVAKKDITATVLSKVNAMITTGELRIPTGYSPENALKSAYLVLSETKNAAGKTALEVCTPHSVSMALLKMVVWGLSPMKKQCDFIMYGDKLECSAEYTGNMALAKRWGGLVDVKASAVFEGDDFDFETDPQTGIKRIIKHTQTLQSIGSEKVVGAYAVMTMAGGTRWVEVMSIEMIRKAWGQGGSKGASPAHKNFPDQMAIKTVINRACKLIIRSSDDSILYSADDEPTLNVVEEQVAHEIRTEANKEVFKITPVEEPEPELEIDQATGEIVETKPNF